MAAQVPSQCNASSTQFGAIFSQLQAVPSWLEIFFSLVKFEDYAEASAWPLAMLLLFHNPSSTCRQHLPMKSETSVILAALPAQSNTSSSLSTQIPQSSYIHSLLSIPTATTVWGTFVAHTRTAMVSYTGLPAPSLASPSYSPHRS